MPGPTRVFLLAGVPVFLLAIIPQIPWHVVSQNRFSYIVRVGSLHKGYICLGVIVSDRHVLTAAHCLESATPTVLVQPRSVHNDRRSQGVKEITGSFVYIHPDWNSAFGSGIDAALILLPYSISIPYPIAEPHVPRIGGAVYPSVPVCAFRLANSLHVQRFQVVPNDCCPNNHNLTSDYFCMYQQNVTVEQGMSGGPVIITDIAPVEGIADELQNFQKTTEFGIATNDVLVGIVSFGNHSSLGNTGVGCIHVEKIHPWIVETMKKVPSKKGRNFAHRVLVIFCFIVHGTSAWASFLIINKLFSCLLGWCFSSEEEQARELQKGGIPQGKKRESLG